MTSFICTNNITVYLNVLGCVRFFFSECFCKYLQNLFDQLWNTQVSQGWIAERNFDLQHVQRFRIHGWKTFCSLILHSPLYETSWPWCVVFFIHHFMPLRRFRHVHFLDILIIRFNQFQLSQRMWSSRLATIIMYTWFKQIPLFTWSNFC